MGVLYGAAIRARRMLYQRGLLRSQRISAPVISVGNLTTGGTGKTPLVESIARIVAAEGKRVCILTRGYGRKDPRQRVVVSDGKALLADAIDAGDEPRLLAENLLGFAAVVSDPDRVSAAIWASKNFASEVFILDDGFQHLKIARDLNILVVDATNPWGGGQLLPRGRLREPLNGMQRADSIVITHADQATDIGSLKVKIAELAGAKPVITSRVRTKGLRPIQQATAIADAPAGPLGAFCGLGNPDSFFAHLKLDGHSICFSRKFPDHHIYQQSEVDQLVSEARINGAQMLLTTAKDAVKLRTLRFDMPCYALDIELSFGEEAELRQIVQSAASPESHPA
ncbi:MAG: tetraacyldisaccharide 4-kinase [Blastocatellia bacterium]|jgi:tetraacyldisaccharide 4'-kinase|nr:tetraacyldisaccharide 4-kinase [Blastocatellia bacterium]